MGGSAGAAASAVATAARRDRADGAPDHAVPEGAVRPVRLPRPAANILTNPQLDPFGKIPEFKYCAVRVEAAPTRT